MRQQNQTRSTRLRGLALLIVQCAACGCPCADSPCRSSDADPYRWRSVAGPIRPAVSGATLQAPQSVAAVDDTLPALPPATPWRVQFDTAIQLQAPETVSLLTAGNVAQEAERPRPLPSLQSDQPAQSVHSVPPEQLEPSATSAVVAPSDLPRLSPPLPSGPQLLPATRPVPPAIEPVDPLAEFAVEDLNLKWWTGEIGKPILSPSRHLGFDLPSVLTDALRSSPYIQSLAHETSAVVFETVEREAAFDPRLLLETRTGRTSDPVGNTLVTGGPPRLVEKNLNMRMGVRQKSRSGLQVDVTQSTDLLNSNSVFFTPQNQGSTRLSISLTQPLLAGSGRLYNERLLLQAQLKQDGALQDLNSSLAERIGDCIMAYWRLYEQRCHLIQQQALLERGEEIERIIAARRSFDAGQVDWLRAHERVAWRHDQVIRAQAKLRNQQTELAMLVGAPTMLELSMAEFIVVGPPQPFEIQGSLRDAVTVAFQHRPEIHLAATDLESAALELRVSRNQLLPRLDAVVESYLAALNGSEDVGGALVDQFQGDPGISAGLAFEFPVQNRAARARVDRSRQLWLAASERLREAMLVTRSETELAYRDLQTAELRTLSTERTLHALKLEELVLTRRWESLAGQGGGAGLILEDLLEVQRRRTTAEQEFVSAQVEQMLALVRLQLAMGTLLRQEGIQTEQFDATGEIEFQMARRGAQPDSPAEAKTE